MNHSQHGFTLIELIIFLVITSLLGVTIGIALITTLSKIPTINQQLVAYQTARKCLEWFQGQNQLKGYSSITCPSTSVPSYCTAPSGYSLSVNSACTTLNSDSNYKTITVTVSGDGSATLSMLIAAY